MAQTFPLNSTALPDDPAWAELDATLAGLPDAWTVLRERRVGGPDGPHVDFLLVHPEIGIALVTVAPEDPEPAKAALADYLGRECFGEFYPGVLPMVAVTIGPDEIMSVGDRLAEAFSQVPSLDIGDPEWSEAAIELLLTPGDLAMASIAPPAGARTEATAGEEPAFAPSGRDAPPHPAVGIAPAMPAFEASPAPRPAWLADLDRAPPRPFADATYLTRPPRRRWYGIAAIAGGLVIVCGIAIGAATQLLDNEPAGIAAGEEVASSSVPLPPATSPSRALPAPQAVPTTPAAQAASAAPPPVPPPPPVVAAAKPLLPPPTPGPRLTRVDPLPAPPHTPPAPVVAAAPPKPPAKPAIAAAPPPKPPAKTETAAAPPTKPVPRVARKEPPAKAPHHQEVATARPAAKPAEPPQAAPAPSVASREPASQDMPPIDAADLPPLAPAADNPPPSDTAPRDVARAEPASTVPPPAPIGAPIRLLAPAVSAGSTTPPPAARTPAPTQHVGPPVPLLPPAVSRPAAAVPRESRAVPIESPESAGSPIVTARLDERECRPYTSDTSLMGQARPVRGMACREPDGRWHLVSELPQR